MPRILALDYGLAKIGLALSDERKILASPHPYIESRRKPAETIVNIQKYVTMPIEKIIIGFPLFLDGKESPMCAEVRKFSLLLEEAFKVPVVLWDERLTTAQIEKMLKEANISRKKRSKISDSLAATLILQNYLEAHARSMDA